MCVARGLGIRGNSGGNFLGFKALLHYALGLRFGNLKHSKTCEINARKLPKMRKCSMLHYALVKNASHLRFSHIFLAFFSPCSRVCAHKHYQNAKQTHSVIWALDLMFLTLKNNKVTWPFLKINL